MQTESTPAPKHRDKPILKVWLDAQALTIKGADAADFLQGYLTCDTKRLARREVIPMALCTVKGRTLASGWAISRPDGIALIIHASLVEQVKAFLKPYITFSKCTLVGETEAIYVTRTATRATTITEAETGAETKTDNPATEFLTDVAFIDYSAHDNTDLGKIEDCSQDMAELLIQHKFVFISAAISEQFLPQMLNLDDAGALDFDKGCYLGQEIVARVQFRGTVKRKTKAFVWQDQEPKVGDLLTLGDLDGTVVATAQSGDGLVCTKIDR